MFSRVTLFLMHVVLNSLPNEYSQLKSTYDARKKKEMWSLNELTVMCVNKEQHIKKEVFEKKLNMVLSSKILLQRLTMREHHCIIQNLVCIRVSRVPKGSVSSARNFRHMKKSYQKYKKWFHRVTTQFLRVKF